MHIFPFSATTFPTGKGENVTFRSVKRHFTNIISLSDFYNPDKQITNIFV
jgi:hypothetical protein